MTPVTLHKTPNVQPLPHARRQVLFISLVTLFIFAVPVFVFYATGYRYNIFSPDAVITATGGLYISILSDTGELYLNEEPVRDVRIFRNASYLQNLMPGIQRVHVQAPLLHTWVKELPVYAHIVTEAEAFLLPVVPQIRVISEYVTATGSPVIVVQSASSSIALSSFASTSIPIYATTSRATTTYLRNTEFDYIVQLFGTSSESEDSLLGRVVGGVTDAFQFAPIPGSGTSSLVTSTATTTREWNNIELFARGREVFAQYIGPEWDTPYYFCVPINSLASTTELYGAQVMHGVSMALASTPNQSTTIKTLTESSSRICRKEIRIDTNYQNVHYFDFFPGSSDLIVVHLDDGVYVVEVDDRAWQNMQKIYPASAEEVLIEGGQIYIKEGTQFLELFTTLLES